MILTGIPLIFAIFIVGAFLIPYVIMVILAGVPLIFLEMCIGQYSSLSVVSVWRACPLFKGKKNIIDILVTLSGIVLIRKSKTYKPQATYKLLHALIKMPIVSINHQKSVSAKNFRL